jgi:hypothetical protein
MLTCWTLTTLLFISGLEEDRTTTVGMSGRIDQLVLPGTELEVAPTTDVKAPVLLRIVRVFKHGNAYRYDLEYQGLEPGSFDLKKYLRRKDGSSAADLPAIPIKVTGSLPPGQVKPHELEIRPTPYLGGYWFIQIGVIVLWVTGLAVIIFLGFFCRQKPRLALEDKPLSLADKLRPLVEGAMAGKLSPPELACLERTLLAYWRKRLHLEQTEPAEAIALLRSHAEAGPLLEQLEVWLHKAEPDREVNPALLLAPYHELPADALEVTAA